MTEPVQEMLEGYQPAKNYKRTKEVITRYGCKICGSNKVVPSRAYPGHFYCLNCTIVGLNQVEELG